MGTTTDLIPSETIAEPTTMDMVAEYASFQPLVVYEDDAGKLTVAILEGVKGANTTRGDSEKMKVRKQGVRKGEVGYNAKATALVRSLVPVLAFIEEALVDEMLISPTALAMGMAALDTLNPRINPLVDVLVEDYEESAPLEREFFLPTPEEFNSDCEDGFMGTTTANVISAVELAPEVIDTPHHTTVNENDPTLVPGLVEDGELVGFDPAVHIVP